MSGGVVAGTHAVHLRVSASQREWLRAAAAERGQSVQQLLELRVFGDPLPRRRQRKCEASADQDDLGFSVKAVSHGDSAAGMQTVHFRMSPAQRDVLRAAAAAASVSMLQLLEVRVFGEARPRRNELLKAAREAERGQQTTMAGLSVEELLATG